MFCIKNLYLMKVTICLYFNICISLFRRGYSPHYIAGKKNDQEQKQRTEQPNKHVTPAAATMIMDNDNNSNSSFVVVKSTLSNDNNTPLAATDDEVLKTTNNKELLSIISSLKLQLENEKATVNVLQKQKEGTLSFSPDIIILKTIIIPNGLKSPWFF